MSELILNIGRFTIRTFTTDRFRLDGGAMFGSVPKTLWSKSVPADDRNRIQLACRLLEIRTESRIFLVDLGMGRKWGEKEREIYAIEHLLELKATTTPTDIIITHLHFDHSGGISTRTNSGELELTFPEAKTWVSEKNVQHGRAPGPRERASYLEDNIAPILNSSYQLCCDGDEIFPGISVHHSNGHTPGLQWVKIRGTERTVVFPADLIPTSHHIQIPYVMGYDLCAETSMREKTEFLEQAAAGSWIIIFEHDAECPAGTVTTGDNGKFVFSPFHG